MNNINKEDIIFEKEEYNRLLKLISCLKNFQNIININANLSIEITNNNKNEIFNIIQKNLKFIEDELLKENPFELICLKLFKLLFLYKDSLNYDDFDEKIQDYQLVLKLLKNQLDIKEKKDYIYKVMQMKNIDEWKRLLRLNYITNTDLEILIVIMLKFSKSVVEISDFLILILKKKHENNFEVKFDLTNLIDIPEKTIAINFLELFKDNTEYFYLDFINGKIEKKFLSPEKTSIAINKSQSGNSESKQRKKKKRKKNKEKEKSEIKQEEVQLNEDIKES